MNDASLFGLEERLYATPLVKYGSPILKTPNAVPSVYDGRNLPVFLLDNGGNPHDVIGFLRHNKIGSPFDLEEGQEVSVPQKGNPFPTHSEA